ncbi:hypothetical protein QWJ34_13690 [Saccharibacillus sp. CPCC 101409]|uniref:hypothetical protein n=1 Tax=Saccharibacillus sp. CPCC 101409 TaxID=3058041 RepID=UPI0026738C43|nr:hypothetical protein [Saccharibacillus sp. CPCC 101409]MDO3410820.1 hypothetical protein [Saccharibacillus sp. CPCC 101409]
MDKQVQSLTEWLNALNGKTIKIEKTENGDTDIVHFELQEVGERPQDNPVDDYLERALLLRGSGSIVNADGESVPVPGDTYEIVLNELEVGGQGGTSLSLKNDRAEYTLTAAE